LIVGDADCLQEAVPASLARHRFRALTKQMADNRLWPQGERSKTMSRPDLVALWHVHSVLDSSLIKRGDLNCPGRR